jgi:hypothetical protein
MGKKSIRAIAFVLRCSGAATVGYELASAPGLHEALWAAMSAAIVSPVGAGTSELNPP